MRLANKLAVLFYAMWGVLHIAGGIAIVAQSSLASRIALQATARAPEEYGSITSEAVNGVIGYHGFNLIWFGFFAIFVSVALIWRNLPLGFWLNLLVLSMVEFGLVTFMLIPGHMQWADGSIGLGLFFLGLIFSSIGMLPQAPPRRMEPA